MDVNYLIEFAELAKHPNITETARTLNMTQPTLSKHIAALEKELKMSLFDRSGNKLSLTKTGSALLPGAYKVIDAQHDFEALVRQLKKNPPPHLTLYGLSDEGPSTEILGYVVSALSEKYGTGFLEVKSDRNRAPENVLDCNDADMVLDSSDLEAGLDERGEKAALMGTLPIMAFVDKRNSLAEHNELPLSAFKETDIIKCEGIYIERSWCHIERACKAQGFTPKVHTIHCSNIAEMLAMCANLDSRVLFLADNFAPRLPRGIAEHCKPIRLPLSDISVPLFFRYKADNDNPLVAELVEHLKNLEGGLSL